MAKENKSTGPEILLYSTVDGKAKIEVCMEDETVWLWQNTMASTGPDFRPSVTEN